MDAAYDLALLHEELGEGLTPLNHVPAARSGPMPLPLPPYKHRNSDEKRSVEVQKTSQSEDKWSALRNYRKSKGLCFVCGEKWSKDHMCKSSVQLHIVQELIDHIQSEDTSTIDSSPQDQMSVCSMHLSAAALGKQSSAPTLQLLIELQGMELIFLVDSGSTHSFIDSSLQNMLTNIQTHDPVSVSVAGGGTLQCSSVLKSCSWSCDQVEFATSFRLLPLTSYDGIIRLDWLAQHSPMHVDWVQKWMSFYYQ